MAGRTIENVGKRRVDLQLDHDVMCGNGPCSCTKVARAHLSFSPRGDFSGHTTSKVRCPDVLTILPGATAETLPDGSDIPERIQKCGDFKSNKEILRLR